MAGLARVVPEGLLVEIDPELAERGRAALWSGLDYLVGDAARTDNYRGAVPADLVLACGIFGNISDDDIAATVRAMPTFLAAGGTVTGSPPHRGRCPRASICSRSCADYEPRYLSTASDRRRRPWRLRRRDA